MDDNEQEMMDWLWGVEEEAKEEPKAEKIAKIAETEEVETVVA